MNNKTWIDYTKVLCMFLVYLNHMEIYYGYSIPGAEILYRPFFVNLFFIVSGYLLFRKYLSTNYSSFNNCEWGVTIRKEILPNIFYKLFIPTILFATINYFPKKIIRSEPIDAISLISDTIGGGSLWFTSAMVIAQLLLCLMLYRRRSIAFHLSISFVLLLIANLLRGYNVVIFESLSFPWYYKSGMIAVFFMSIGGFYWKFEKRISTVLHAHRWILLVLLSIYLLFVVSGKARCNTINADVNFLGIIATCLSSLLIIELFKNFRPLNTITFIGRNSIGFYFLSGSIPNIVALVCKRTITCADNMIYLLVPISFCIAYICVKIIVTYFPYLFDLRRISR